MRMRRPGIEKKNKGSGDIHTATVSPVAADRPLERLLHDRSPWITQAEISAADDFCLIGFWRGVVNGSRSMHPPSVLTKQTKSKGKIVREKKGGGYRVEREREMRVNGHGSLSKTRAPTGFPDAEVVVVEAERKDRECPCVSASSYATTGYRRLASRPRPRL